MRTNQLYNVLKKKQICQKKHGLHPSSLEWFIYRLIQKEGKPFKTASRTEWSDIPILKCVANFVHVFLAV